MITQIKYSSGKPCPVLGGQPEDVQYMNCPCLNEYPHCAREAIVPICVGCANKVECHLQPTSSCSLFVLNDVLRDEFKTAGAQEDCEALQMDEHVCSTCGYYNECWGESPWTEANRVWYGKDHIGI